MNNSSITFTSHIVLLSNPFWLNETFHVKRQIEYNSHFGDLQIEKTPLSMLYSCNIIITFACLEPFKCILMKL